MDDRFLDGLKRDKHLIVHGSSKQGKTCLRKVHLTDDQIVVIQCTRGLRKERLYELLLKGADVRLNRSNTQKITETRHAEASGGVEGSVPFLTKAKATFAGKRAQTEEATTSSEEFEIDLSDPNDIVRLLRISGFSKHIILEDFHYLEEDVQRSFSFDLKTFHEKTDLLFLVVGVWLEANRLTMFNGDLNGRVTAIDADSWAGADMGRIIKTGEDLLNIRIPDPAKRELIRGSLGNVGLLQEACYRLCEKSGVVETQQESTVVGTPEAVTQMYRELAADQAARYLNCLASLAYGFGEEDLQLYRWIAVVVASSRAGDLRRGIRSDTVFRSIKTVHPRGTEIKRNLVTDYLRKIASVQHANKIQPPILDFVDDSLRAVDANFLLFLETQEKEAMFREVGLSESVVSRVARKLEYSLIRHE